MNIADICIAFTVSILSVAFPLLLTVISRLDDKYQSVLLLELFKAELSWRIAKAALIVTLCCIFMYIVLAMPFCDHLPSVYRYVHLFLMVTALTVLIIYLLLFIRKVLTYFTPNKLLPYLMRIPDNDEHKYFRAIADLLYFAIPQADRSMAVSISNYMYSAFLAEREKHEDGPIEYPSSFYEAQSTIVRKLAALKNREFTFLNYRVAGGIWLLGELQDVEISDVTFRQLWEDMVTAVEYERDDFVQYFWEVAHQHFVYNLASVYEEHSDMADGLRVLNQEKIDHRKKERKRFLEFMYALGGMMLYEKRYHVFRGFFTHTTSQPASYDLLPLSMWQVFTGFVDFTDPYRLFQDGPLQRYYFYQRSGITGEGLVRYHTGQYFALLFLRQWSIVPYLMTIEPFNYPQAPINQSDKRTWLDQIGYFRKLVQEVYNNRGLLEAAGLGFLTDDWCRENNKTLPLHWIDEFDRSINDAFTAAENQQPVSAEKAQAFYTSSGNILRSTLETYADVFSQPIADNYDHWQINGVKSPMEKSPFAEDQGVSHLNFDSFVATMKAQDIKEAISETFMYKTTQRYLLKGADIFEAIDKIRIKAETHMIINFGISLEWYVTHEKVEGLTMKSYNSIHILTFTNFNREMMPSGLYLLRKEDLPYLHVSEPPADEIRDYGLELLVEKFHIYGSVIDLHLRRDLADQLTEEDRANASKLVLLYLAMHLEIRWKKQVKVVALNQYSEYRNNGIPNNLRDIKRW